LRRSPAALLLAAVLVYPILLTKPFPRHVAIMIFLYGALATAWNILAGYCGQVSLGHAVYFGIGAYTSTLLFREAALTPWLGMTAGAALAVVVSQAIGYPVFRLRGHYFAIATIGVGEIVQTLVINWDRVGGARGLFVPIRRPDSVLNLQFHDSKAVYYYIALSLLALSLAATRWVERSRRGYFFRAIREDQEAAASLGVHVAREKHVAMAVSAALTALGGTFYAQYVLFIDPESVFPLSLSILICLVAVLGGVGSLWGPLLGAAVLVPLSEGTRVLLGGTGKALDLVIYGALIMLIAVFQPAGLIGLARRLRPSRGGGPAEAGTSHGASA
jgi:branched-chain amino acid transport system permease protein